MCLFVQLPMEYLLTEQEVGDVVNYIGKNIAGKDLEDMYTSDNREYYARMLLANVRLWIVKGGVLC